MAKQAPDLGKMMEQLKVPGVDWSELMAAHQRNLEALTKANQLMLQGAEAVMKRELEIMHKAFEEAMSAAQELLQESDPKTSTAKRFELARHAFETALTNTRELTELASRSHKDATEVLNKRALSAFDEMRSALAKSGK
jgi:phasin family protein